MMETPWLEECKTQVAKALQQDRVPHAWLITGVRGLGKVEFARFVSAVLLRESLLETGDWTAAGEFADGHPDFEELTPADGKASISVDQVRGLSRSLTLKSHQGQRKVALLYPAEAMTHSAANSLLKTLEEPPGDSVLILVSDHWSKLPATVLSRCQRLLVSKPAPTDALQWLVAQEDGPNWELALRLTQGAPLEALKWHRQGRLELALSLLKDVAKIIRGEISPSQSAPRWEKAGPWSLVCLEAWAQEGIKLKSGVPESELGLNALGLDLQEL
ncbi:MAG: hypothetical protein AAF438_11395, partial [Pseudomonadota bacterium]